jgi:putative oxidoreductase
MGLGAKPNRVTTRQTHVETSENQLKSEPRLIFPALAPFYNWARELSWPIIRITVGGTLLVHGISKLMGPGVTAFSGGLAQRGIEPALPFAYAVFSLETVGAVLIILGLFTRPIAAAIAIEFAVITFIAHFPNGYGWSSPRGGWEYPLLWGLIFFAISLRGGGPYSFDRKIGREV